MAAWHLLGGNQHFIMIMNCEEIKDNEHFEDDNFVWLSGSWSCNTAAGFDDNDDNDGGEYGKGSVEKSHLLLGIA